MQCMVPFFQETKKVGGIDTQCSLLNCRIVLVNVNQGAMLNNVCGIVIELNIILILHSSPFVQ